MHDWKQFELIRKKNSKLSYTKKNSSNFVFLYIAELDVNPLVMRTRW